MIELRHVQSLVAVLSTGSFHAAGRRLGLAQPTVSQHVRKLEAELRTTLVERAKAGCRPTAQARALLPYAESLLRLSARAVEAVRGGRLALGASGNIGTYLLPDLLRRLGSVAGPAAEVAVSTNDAVLGRLFDGDLDVALVEWWEPRAGFAAFAWRQEPLVAIAAPGHAWARLEKVHIGALADHPMLGGEPATGTGRILREALTAVRAPPVRVGLALGSTEAVKRAVRQGLGVSIVLACAVEDEVRAGSLAALPVDGADLSKTLYAAHREPLPDTAPAAALLEALRGPRADAMSLLP